MDENVQKLRVGIYTLIVMLILAILIFLNSEGWSSNYNVVIRPTSAPGVREGTPVRKNGILIGRVASVRTQDDHVVLRMAIKETERIYANETVSIGAESFLGDAGLEIVPLPSDQRGELVMDNQEMFDIEIQPGVREAFEALSRIAPVFENVLKSIKESSESVADAGKGVEELAATINGAFVNDDSDLKRLVADIRSLSGKAEAAVDNVNGIFEQVNGYISDPEFRDNMEELVQTLPKIFREVRVMLSDARKVVKSFSGVGGKVEKTLDDVGKFTASLGDKGPGIVDDVSAGIKDLRGFVKQAEGFSDTLAALQKTFENQDGTVGKLFGESELYDQLLVTVRELKETVGTVKRVSTKLEPLMNDVRVTADKVARDPGGILRGALQKKPVGSGYKSTPGNRGLLR
jgi:phospholipid/cholesterol/gamma-HCH transport system substrate-binding protein